MKKILLLVIIGIVIVGGCSFYGGIQYGKSTITTQNGQFSRTMGPQGTNRTGSRAMSGSQVRGGGMIAGEVLSKDDTSITIKLPDGGSKNIFLSSSTKVMRSTEGNISEIGIGTQIFGQGTTNPDGSISAQTIQLR